MTLKLFWFVALKNTFPSTGWFLEKKSWYLLDTWIFSNIMCWKIDPNMGIKIRDAWNFSLDSFKEALMPKSHIKRNIVLLFFGFEISSKQLQPLLKLGNKLSTSLGLLLLAPCQEDVKEKEAGMQAGWLGLDEDDKGVLLVGPIRLPLIVTYTQPKKVIQYQHRENHVESSAHVVSSEIVSWFFLVASSNWFMPLNHIGSLGRIHQESQ